MIFKKKAIEHLNEKLYLPYTGIEQDWDIEMANSERLNEFIIFYKSNKLELDEKVALMALIIASCDDLITKNNVNINIQWDDIKIIINAEKVIFIELLNYWKLVGETRKEYLFNITPLIREIML